MPKSGDRNINKMFKNNMILEQHEEIVMHELSGLICTENYEGKKKLKNHFVLQNLLSKNIVLYLTL